MGIVKSKKNVYLTLRDIKKEVLDRRTEWTVAFLNRNKRAYDINKNGLGIYILEENK